MGRSRIFVVQVSHDTDGAWSAMVSPLGAEPAASRRFDDPAALVAFVAGAGADRRPSALQGRLSSRENEVALLFAAGCTHKRIAQGLALAPATVRNHLSAVYRKLGVDSRTALVAALAATDTPIQGDGLVHLHHGAGAVTHADWFRAGGPPARLRAGDAVSGASSGSGADVTTPEDR